VIVHLIWKRYSRSGYAPQAFYAVMALAFLALAVWALVRAEWLIAAGAIAMIAVTAGGSRVMRRLGDAARASEHRYATREEQDHE
jgi:hypothetical protein